MNGMAFCRFLLPGCHKIMDVKQLSLPQLF